MRIKVIPDIGECADLGYIRFQGETKTSRTKLVGEFQSVIPEVLVPEESFPTGYSFPRSFLPQALGVSNNFANSGNFEQPITRKKRDACPINDFRPFVLRGDDCVLCDSEDDGFVYLTVVAILLFVPLVLYVLYHFASSAWRPSNRTGVECIVLSGQCEDSVPSETLKKRLAAHMDVVEGEVKVDHAGAELQPGDDVLVEGWADKRCGLKKVELNGHVGTVLECKEDTAKVCVHGFSGTWVLPLDSLKIQALFVETPQDAPA